MTSAQQALENLVKVGRLIPEPPSQPEFDRMVRLAQLRLPDAEHDAIQVSNRFIVAYDAAHSLALAALRWHGYRAKDRAVVFQLLEHTAGLAHGQWRFLHDCHQKRNVALYEGGYYGDERVVAELIQVTKALLAAVERLGPISV